MNPGWGPGFQSTLARQVFSCCCLLVDVSAHTVVGALATSPFSLVQGASIAGPFNLVSSPEFSWMMWTIRSISRHAGADGSPKPKRKSA
jgi:hypothetical protein